MAHTERPFKMRHGMREYEITEQEYMQPGRLVDDLLNDDICKAGGFIARLSTWTPADGDSNLKAVKGIIEGDNALRCFHPEWLLRQTLIPRTVFKIDVVHGQTFSDGDPKEEEVQTLSRLQRSMQTKIKSCDFASDDDSFDLCAAFRNCSLLDTVDMVMDTLENKANNIIYVQNMDLPVPLSTTATCSMTEMVTGLEELGNKPISGISKPLVYVGTGYSVFGCHREDMSFCALNRHIKGAPKVWLCVPPAYYGAFCTMVRNLPIPEDQTSLLCQVLHKELWIDPRMVILCGIPVYPIVQMPGDIVFLLPNTIHWGYNMGFNVNEATNFVNRSWILPGMLSHQRCKCTKWYCRFEIRHILRALGVEDNDLRTWESGMKLTIISRLKEAQPLLYPQLRDLYDEKVKSNYLLADTREEHDEQHEMSQEVRRPKCTQCNYFPERKYSDAVKRIYNHAVRCHGELEAAKIRDQIIAEFGPAARKYKGKTMVCGNCGAEIRGKTQNMVDHQNTKKCKKAAEGRTSASAESAPPTNRSRRKCRDS